MGRPLEANVKEPNRRGGRAVCAACGVLKRLTDFNKLANPKKYKAGDPRRYNKKCKECTRARAATDPAFKTDRRGAKRKRLLTTEEKRANAASYRRGVRRRTRIKVLEYLADKGCETCGERDPRVLEFDHIEPCKKDDAICKLLSDGYSWAAERLRREIRKCRVLCANCHRLHTADQMEYYGHDDVQRALKGIYAKHGIEE